MRIAKVKLSDDKLVDNLKVIALHYGRDKSADEIAKQTGFKREKVQSYASALRANGINIPRLSKVGTMLRAIAEIKKEYPQLVSKHLKK